MECKGSAQILTVTLLLIGIMALSYLMEGLRVFNLVGLVRESIEQATVSAAADNAYNAYAGLREGNAAPYIPNGSDWQLAVDTSDVARNLSVQQSLLHKDSSFYKEAGGNVQWSVNSLNVSTLPPDIRSDNSILLRFKTSYYLHIPVRFMGDLKGTIKVPQTVKSSYIPLY